MVRVFSTANCARMAELRRGVDQAIILALAISPSSKLLAVTSDKSTLHIFDLPHPRHGMRPGTSGHDRQSSPGTQPTPSGSIDDGAKQKWGILAKLPMMPRVFSDIYSFASAPFEVGDEPINASRRSAASSANALLYGVPGGRPPKGVIAWTSDEMIIVAGAGRDGRWERFVITEGEGGKRSCVQDGWRRYLGSK